MADSIPPLDVCDAPAADVTSAPVPVVLELAAQGLEAEGLIVQVETVEALAERLRQLASRLPLVDQEIGSFLEDEDAGELVTVERYRLQRWSDLLRGGAR